MTPFDPWALLAMLQAFYPAPTPASLRRARSERPEYFAAGVLIGHSGDKLQLPDGRIWDLIFSVGSPAARWIAIDVTDQGAGGGGDDPFALEEGPLVPIDEETTIGPPLERDFEGLVARGLGDLTGSDDRLAAAGAAVVEVDGGADIDRSYDELLEPANRAHVGMRAALDLDDPSELIDATNHHDGEINAGTGDYNEPPPPDDPEPDPGEPPNGGDDGGKPPKEL